MPPHTLTGSITATFWLDGQTRPINIPLSVIYGGGKMQDIPIGSAAQTGDNETIYTGAGVDGWTFFAGVNYTGWAIDFDPNNTGNAMTLPPSPNPTAATPLPGGVALFAMNAADADAVGNFGQLLYGAYLELTSAEGSEGVFSIVALGDLLP